jgi:hypothetical protein
LSSCLALAITLAIAGAIASQAPHARGGVRIACPRSWINSNADRTAIDVLSQGGARLGSERRRKPSARPVIRACSQVVSVSDPDDSGAAFTSMTVILAVKDAAQGILSADQSAPGGSADAGHGAVPERQGRLRVHGRAPPRLSPTATATSMSSSVASTSPARGS